ncbi:hypothetical protein PR048_009639 [Dryococelus australis]|uniref:Uncharacterized protein n=1 Tax=Dryococelus australis TaxID=614101 RepID=A0ABQ9I0F4_9NEOP|nr:hypothetical protein PR048_009639 [Dryococelus australis]
MGNIVCGSHMNGQIGAAFTPGSTRGPIIGCSSHWATAAPQLGSLATALLRPHYRVLYPLRFCGPTRLSGAGGGSAMNSSSSASCGQPAKQSGLKPPAKISRPCSVAPKPSLPAAATPRASEYLTPFTDYNHYTGFFSPQPPLSWRGVHSRSNTAGKQQSTLRNGIRLPVAILLLHCGIQLLANSSHHHAIVGATVAERLVCSPPTKAIRVLSPVQVTPNFRMWGSCRAMPLVGGFSRGALVSPALSFRHCSILNSITFIGSQDLDVKSRPNIFISLYRPGEQAPDHASQSLAKAKWDKPPWEPCVQGQEARKRYGRHYHALLAPHRSYAQGVQCFRRDAVLCKLDLCGVRIMLHDEARAKCDEGHIRRECTCRAETLFREVLTVLVTCMCHLLSHVSRVVMLRPGRLAALRGVQGGGSVPIRHLRRPGWTADRRSAHARHAGRGRCEGVANDVSAHPEPRPTPSAT